jgi:PIN domain nuclease of toxin-antitoxin system
MKLLLDTHAFLWWLDPQNPLSNAARRAIGDPQNEVFVSAVIALEIAVKRAMGKLTFPGDFSSLMAANGFQPLPITIDHALGVESLPPHHRDPFDRLLVAQAQAEGMHLVTRDAHVLKYAVPSIPA